MSSAKHPRRTGDLDVHNPVDAVDPAAISEANTSDHKDDEAEDGEAEDPRKAARTAGPGDCSAISATLTVDSLPSELILRIFSYLDIVSLRVLRVVSRAWLDLTNSKCLKKIARFDVLLLLRFYHDMHVFLQTHDKFEGDELEHAILERGERVGPLWICDHSLEFDAGQYFPVFFNADKCPNLEQLTVDTMELRLRDMSCLSKKCQLVNLINVALIPFLDGNDFRCLLFGCVPVRVVHCRNKLSDPPGLSMKDWWKIVESAADPLTDAENEVMMSILPELGQVFPHVLFFLQQ